MFRPQYPVLKVRRRRSPDAQGDTLHRRVPSVKGFSRKFSRAPRGGPRGAPAPPRAGPPPRKRDWHYTPPAPRPGAGGGGLHGIPTNGGLRGGRRAAGRGGAGGRVGSEGAGGLRGRRLRWRGASARDLREGSAPPRSPVPRTGPGARSESAASRDRSTAAAGTSTVNDVATPQLITNRAPRQTASRLPLLK